MKVLLVMYGNLGFCILEQHFHVRTPATLRSVLWRCPASLIGVRPSKSCLHGFDLGMHRFDLCGVRGVHVFNLPCTGFRPPPCSGNCAADRGG